MSNTNYLKFLGLTNSESEDWSSLVGPDHQRYHTVGFCDHCGHVEQNTVKKDSCNKCNYALFFRRIGDTSLTSVIGKFKTTFFNRTKGKKKSIPQKLEA